MGDSARDALLKAASWFKEYEANHRAKGTADSLAKAEVNKERAAWLTAQAGRATQDS